MNLFIYAEIFTEEEDEWDYFIIYHHQDLSVFFR